MRKTSNAAWIFHRSSSCWEQRLGFLQRAPCRRERPTSGTDWNAWRLPGRELDWPGAVRGTAGRARPSVVELGDARHLAFWTRIGLARASGDLRRTPRTSLSTTGSSTAFILFQSQPRCRARLRGTEQWTSREPRGARGSGAGNRTPRRSAGRAHGAGRGRGGNAAGGPSEGAARPGARRARGFGLSRVASGRAAGRRRLGSFRPGSGASLGRRGRARGAAEARCARGGGGGNGGRSWRLAPGAPRRPPGPRAQGAGTQTHRGNCGCI